MQCENFPKSITLWLHFWKCNQDAINESPHKNNCTWLAFSKVQWKRNENEADVESIWGKFKQNIFKTEIEFGWKRVENENFALQPWFLFEKNIKIFKHTSQRQPALEKYSNYLPETKTSDTCRWPWTVSQFPEDHQRHRVQWKTPAQWWKPWRGGASTHPRKR